MHPLPATCHAPAALVVFVSSTCRPLCLQPCLSRPSQDLRLPVIPISAEISFAPSSSLATQSERFPLRLSLFTSSTLITSFFFIGSAFVSPLSPCPQKEVLRERISLLYCSELPLPSSPKCPQQSQCLKYLSEK